MNTGSAPNTYWWVAFGNDTATHVYYSVGTNAAALYSGDASASSGTLTLADPAANNVGVGDEIRVGLNRYYITRRASSTSFSIQNSGANGGVPGTTSITFPSQAIAIHRAFNSLSAAHTGSYDANHLKTGDLVTGNYQLNWPCYADNAMSNSVRIRTLGGPGYATGPTNYIRVFTPTLGGEVGASQRHNGVFGSGFQLNGPVNTKIDPGRHPVHPHRGSGHPAHRHERRRDGHLRATRRGVRRPHLPQHHQGCDQRRRDRWPHWYPGGIGWRREVFRIWNNVVYNFTADGWGMALTNGIVYVFNNTVFNSQVGIGKNSNVTGEVSNNASLHDTASDPGFTDYYLLAGPPAVTRRYNVSSDTTSTTGGGCTGCQTGKTALATYFKNTASGTEDLHLRGTSLALWTANGTDLAGDANLAVTIDVDGGAARDRGPTSAPTSSRHSRCTVRGHHARRRCERRGQCAHHLGLHSDLRQPASGQHRRG